MVPLRVLQPAQEAMATAKGLSPRPPAETHIQSQRDKFLTDVGAWAGNVSTSVLIVFVNKVLLKNYAYHYATTLVRAMGLTASQQSSGQRHVGRELLPQGCAAAPLPLPLLAACNLPPTLVPCRQHYTSWYALLASGLHRRAA